MFFKNLNKATLVLVLLFFFSCLENRELEYNHYDVADFKESGEDGKYSLPKVRLNDTDMSVQDLILPPL